MLGQFDTPTGHLVPMRPRPGKGLPGGGKGRITHRCSGQRTTCHQHRQFLHQPGDAVPVNRHMVKAKVKTMLGITQTHQRNAHHPAVCQIVRRGTLRLRGTFGARRQVDIPGCNRRRNNLPVLQRKPGAQADMPRQQGLQRRLQCRAIERACNIETEGFVIGH